MDAYTIGIKGNREEKGDREREGGTGREEQEV